MRYWNQLAGAAAGVALLTGAVLVFTPRPPPHLPRAAHAIADGCRPAQCPATLPATGTPGAASPRAPRPLPTATRHPHTAAARPDRSPRPVPPPAGTRSPAYNGPPVTVGYAVASSQPSARGTRFTGRFTLVNHTGSPVTRWTLQASLPGDRIEWASTSPSGQPRYHGFSRVPGGLAISGTGAGEAVPAHGSLVFYLGGWGPSTSPASCSFNGSPC